MPTLPAGTKLVTLALNLDIPVEEGYGTRAVPGDPGTYERFEVPQYGYVYFVGFDAAGNCVGVGKPALLTGDTPVETTNPLTLSGWNKITKNLDIPQTRGDSIYRYRGNIHFIVPSGTKTGRLYVAASNVTLPNITALDYTTANEQSVLDITFDAEGSAIRSNLQNVYSSPYNYTPNDGLAGSILDGNTYYGTITDLDNSEPKQVNLLLYHVAAKVDVVWNVVEAQQENFWISFIEARKLYEKGCLLFRPTENVIADTEPTREKYDGDIYTGKTNGYDLTLIGWNGVAAGGSFNDDRGRQWYGRQYFYTIPYRFAATNTFDLQLRMLKNDGTQASGTDGYHLLLRKDMSTADAVFVPWLRIDLQFTNEMNYGKVVRGI